MTVHTTSINSFHRFIDAISGLKWSALSQDELMAASCAYYYFSVQFCEAVEIACNLYPSDSKLIELREGELRHQQSFSLSGHSQRRGENEP